MEDYNHLGKGCEVDNEDSATSENFKFDNNPAYLDAKNKEIIKKSANSDNSEDAEAPPISNITPDIHDKDYFNKLFNWDLIQQRLNETVTEPDHQHSEKQHFKFYNEITSVKLRDNLYSSVSRSEAERKRRSKDLLQNRRSTGFLCFQEVENAIRKIEEIGLEIDNNFKHNNEDAIDLEHGNEVSSKSESSQTVDNEECENEPAVKLRDKKSSPFNSAASRKRRSRNLLLNRRSTGYVSVEDVEKAKSLDHDQDDEVHPND